MSEKNSQKPGELVLKTKRGDTRQGTCPTCPSNLSYCRHNLERTKCSDLLLVIKGLKHFFF